MDERNLKLVYYHTFIDAFGVSLIGIFVPIYLLVIGFELPQVFLYLLIEWSMIGLLSPVYAFIISRLGAIRMIIASAIIYSVYLWFLHLLETNTLLRQYYLVFPFVVGIAGGLYFPSVQSAFAATLGKEKQSEKTGKYLALPKIASILGPAVGGVIATKAGFSVLFFVTISLVALAIIPLVMISKRLRVNFTARVFKSIPWKTFLFTMVYGMRSLMTFVIIPLALFLSDVSLMGLGFAFSFLILVESLFTVFVGKISDNHGRTRVLRWGALLSGLTFAILGYTFESSVFLYVVLASGFLLVLIDVPFESYLYNQSRKYHSPLEFLAFKEFSLSLGRLLMLGSVYLLSSQLDIGLYIGSVASLLFFFF